ncbi:hypothetical protein DC363_15620 [Thalassorhabdomicrobium marinisediminis]|uniref:Peptidase M41 domain-containing protein n=1 Tax=Thalassorhabdomicrobium marinisediminis TaxID=2170577 RepID=A0A2T7FTF6_9RHOB|nr:hypothetical protein DC363_15620 [Thalassorhabdomicrobium marinisediminis]
MCRCRTRPVSAISWRITSARRSRSKRLLSQPFSANPAQISPTSPKTQRPARRARTSLTAEHLHQTVADHAPPVCAKHLRRIAAHEAGHIVAAAVLDLALPVRARITPTGAEVLRPARTSYTADIIKAELVCLMAGRAAEQLLIGDISSGSGFWP